MVPRPIRALRKYYLPRLVKASALIEAEPLCYRYYPQYVSQEDTVVEVGVYLGGSTRLLSKLARRVYSFEPHPFNYRVAKALISKGGAANVKLYDFALGSTDGETKLKVKSSSESNIAASTKGVSGVKYESEITVPVRRLDSVGISPDVLILDAEGSELDVMDGGRESLKRLKAAIVETHLIESGHTLPRVKEWAESRFRDVRVVEVQGDIPWVLAKDPLNALA